MFVVLAIGNYSALLSVDHLAGHVTRVERQNAELGHRVAILERGLERAHGAVSSRLDYDLAALDICHERTEQLKYLLLVLSQPKCVKRDGVQFCRARLPSLPTPWREVPLPAPHIPPVEVVR